MLLYKNHLKKFSEDNTFTAAKNLTKYYSELQEKNFEEKAENRLEYDLIEEIIRSGEPYIFIFVQNIFDLRIILDNKKYPANPTIESLLEKNTELLAEIRKMILFLILIIIFYVFFNLYNNKK